MANIFELVHFGVMNNCGDFDYECIVSCLPFRVCIGYFICLDAVVFFFRVTFTTSLNVLH